MSDSNISGVFLLRDVRQRILDDFWPKTAPTVETPIGNVSTVNEGDSITVNVNTFDYEDQTLYWTIEGVTGTINESDFSALSGSFVIQANNFGHFTITTTNDESTEGVESFKVQIRTGSTSGEIKTETTPITINDTSLPDQAWFAGGTFYSQVDRITLSSDTSSVSVRGPLNSYHQYGGGTSNNLYGWFSGGFSSPGPTTRTSRIQRITFSEDTNTAITRGNISQARTGLSSVDNDTYGWSLGGFSPGGEVSRVDRTTFSSDTSTASVRGNLSLARYSSSATENETYGWCFSGDNSSNDIPWRVDRITLSSDTSTASVRNINTSLDAIRDAAAVGNQDYGWIYGGRRFAPGPTSTYETAVRRITYASDTSNSVVRANDSRLREHGATEDENYGWFAGGISHATIVSKVVRITFSSDTTALSTRSPLSALRNGLSAATNAG